MLLAGRGAVHDDPSPAGRDGGQEGAEDLSGDITSSTPQCNRPVQYRGASKELQRLLKGRSLAAVAKHITWEFQLGALFGIRPTFVVLLGGILPFLGPFGAPQFWKLPSASRPNS